VERSHQFLIRLCWSVIEEILITRSTASSGGGSEELSFQIISPLAISRSQRSNFIIQALKNRPLTIYGNGLQTRSFCFVDDLIVGLTLLINFPVDNPGPVNLGNPAEITISLETRRASA
jgi:hypothetical protein